MSKRNITYVKPEEPSFLKKLKEQIGYKEGPTVDTKREELPVDLEDYDIPDEQPTIANLDELSAEDIENYQKQFKAESKKEEEVKEREEVKEVKEEEEGRADLSERVVFRKPPTSSKSSLKRESEITADDQSKSIANQQQNKKVKKDKNKSKKSPGTLSFDFEDNE